MKKSVVFGLVLSVIFFNIADAQVSKLLKNVKKSVTEEITGTPSKSTGSNTGTGKSSVAGNEGSNNSNNSNSNSNNSITNNTPPAEPEPSCACSTAVVIMEMGKYKIDYTELSINILDDGTILVKDIEKKDYYIVKSGITDGPYKGGDPKVSGFMVNNVDENEIEPKDYPLKYSKYISKAGDKYLITFNGKKYGPFSEISRFSVSKTNDKFVAIVTENIIMSAEFIKKYEELGKNLKTDQERIQLSMKMSEEITQKTEKYGPQSPGPIYVTNIPGASFNKELIYVERFYNNIKYGEILTESGSKIYDSRGKELVSYDYSECSPQSMFISSDNSRYACYSEGSLAFSDNIKLADLFNPSLIKADGKVYLSYMYYSPKSNAIMQCRVPF